MCINFPKNFKELETIDKQAIPYVNFICVSHNMQKKKKKINNMGKFVTF